MSDIRFEGWLHRTGTGGVYQDSAGNVGIASTQPKTRLDIQNGAFQIGPAGICTATTVNTTNLINATQLSHRNLIINGAMQVAQRGTSSTTSADYTADRFLVQWSGADESPTHAQVDVAAGTTPYTSGFRKCVKVTNGNQTSGAGAADYMFIKYTVEAQDTAISGWNFKSADSYITLSFWVKSSVAQNFYCYIEMPDSPEQVYPFETGSLTADTWTKITKSIPGNSNIVVNNDTGEGFKVFINQFWGTNFTDSGRALNTWAAFSSGERMPDFTSTWYTTNDATFELTGVQLEVGSVATPFEHRSFADELRRCQRYYFRIPYQGVASSGGVYLGSGKETGSNARIAVDFPVPMRAVPSCAASNLLSDDETSATSANTVASVLASTVEPDRGRVAFSGGSYSSGNSVSLSTGQATDSYLEGSAEL